MFWYFSEETFLGDYCHTCNINAFLADCNLQMIQAEFIKIIVITEHFPYILVSVVLIE